MRLSKILAIFVFAAVAFPAMAAPADTLRVAPARATVLSVGTEVVAGLAVNAGITELLKGTVHEWRPNLEDDRSFPSRHTSWAFAASTILSNQFYASQPWVPLVAQGAATAVALQRLHAGKHYGGDVAAGMLTGVVSAEAGRLLSRAIFGGSAAPVGGEAAFGTTLAVSSEVLLPFGKRFRSGFASSLRFRQPLGGNIGLAASAGAFALCRNRALGEYEAVEGVAAMVGPAYFLPVARSLAFTADVTVGAAFLRRWSTRWAFTGAAHAGVEWFLTDRFAAGLTLGYARYGSLNCSAMTVSATSAVTF